MHYCQTFNANNNDSIQRTLLSADIIPLIPPIPLIHPIPPIPPISPTDLTSPTQVLFTVECSDVTNTRQRMKKGKRKVMHAMIDCAMDESDGRKEMQNTQSNARQELFAEMTRNHLAIDLSLNESIARNALESNALNALTVRQMIENIRHALIEKKKVMSQALNENPLLTKPELKEMAMQLLQSQSQSQSQSVNWSQTEMSDEMLSVQKALSDPFTNELMTNPIFIFDSKNEKQITVDESSVFTALHQFFECVNTEETNSHLRFVVNRALKEGIDSFKEWMKTCNKESMIECVTDDSLSMEIMREAVITYPMGDTFECKDIKQWMTRSNSTHPTSREPIVILSNKPLLAIIRAMTEPLTFDSLIEKYSDNCVITDRIKMHCKSAEIKEPIIFSSFPDWILHIVFQTSLENMTILNASKFKPTVKEIVITDADISQITGVWPPQLQWLQLNRNAIQTFDFEELPQSLTTFGITGNALTDTLKLSSFVATCPLLRNFFVFGNSQLIIDCNY